MKFGTRLLPVVFAASAAACWLPSTAAAVVTWTDTWNVATDIPDGDLSGYADTQTPVFSPGMLISKVTVTLNFSGGWNGDLYAYLSNGSGFAVLLNRPGRAEGAEDGSDTSGMSVTFDDAALDDLHDQIDQLGGSVTGNWQPDARWVNPSEAVTNDVRTAFLSSLNGQSATGPLTLFVADLSVGEVSTLDSWSMTVSAVSAVPEPGGHLALAGLVGGGLLLRRRSGRRSRL
jgi:subtilisin-like proprotein convertase family protein